MIMNVAKIRLLSLLGISFIFFFMACLLVAFNSSPLVLKNTVNFLGYIFLFSFDDQVCIS